MADERPCSDRRHLDPAHPAVVIRNFLPKGRTAEVRTGRHSIEVRAEDADQVGYVHNYMNGHLGHTGRGMPVPVERRQASARPATSQGTSPTVTAIDRQAEDAWRTAIATAVDGLERAVSLDAANQDHTRAAAIRALAVQVREVLDA